MRIAILYSPWCLSFRKTLDLDTWRTDPRGLSGSELCAIRLFQELQEQGHDVTLLTEAKWYPVGIVPWGQRGACEYDVAISINYPDELREVKAKLRVCYQLVNSFDYCKAGFQEHVDLWLSPSNAHRAKMLETQDVELGAEGPKERWSPNPAQWEVVPLGCDPDRFEEDIEGQAIVPRYNKVSGRVVYCSSPDRGLHWLLQEWPAIRRAVPHAHLRIFYRLRDWIAGFENTPYFPPIEGLRARALYIEEALRRLEGHGVELFDSVSRERVEQEMGEAQVLAYPCDTVRWSEGFSCTVLEACAAQACPVITDCDALGNIYRQWSVHYGDACVVVAKEDALGASWQERWRDNVIDVLLNRERREAMNRSAVQFAKGRTWKRTADHIMNLASNHLSSRSESASVTQPESSRIST